MKQTETPAFKRWFGKSKVVDASGKPLVVYHGTGEDFTEFSEEYAPYRGGILAFFSSSPKFASEYSSQGGSPNVMPVYLKIEKPFDYRKDSYVAKSFWEDTGGITDESAVIRMVEDPEELTKEKFYEFVKDGNWAAIEADQFVEYLAKDGYDGIVVKEGGVTNYAVFYPTQIKSAIGNKGTFDPKDANITNPRQSVKGDNKGININDEFQDFTGQILRGEKTIETRPSRSLDSRIGKLTGIIRTGIHNQKATLVGYMVIGEPVVYDSVAKFRKDQSKHLVAPGSEHDIKNGLKYGYPIMQVEPVTPRVITSSGRVIRQLNPYTKRSAPGQFSRQPRRIAMKTKEFRNPATPEDLPPAQGAKAKSPQIDTPEFKRWFNGSVVVTQSGKPRIMYHGTGFTNLGEFRSFRSRSQIAGHFAFDPKFAEEFAMQYSSQEYDDEVDDEKKRYATIYPVYLSLKKLFDVRKKEDRDEIEFEFILKRDGDVKGPNGWTWYQLEKAAVVKRMIEAGFDGFLDFEKGSKNEPTGIAAFNSPSIKSAIGNRGTFDPTDPDIRNPMKTNPMDPRSSMTQIEGTKKTYAKAAKMLTGKVIDYGAGLGVGTDTLRAEGLSVDSFEPYPKKWKGKRPPTYTDSAKIPSSSYDSLVSFSVINVVEPDMRKFLFQEVDRILRPNGVALITGRSRSDVEKSTTKIPHLEEGGYLIDEGEEQRYQKGFTQAELERYAKEVLGPGFTVQKNGSLNGASIKISKGKTNPVTRSMIRTKLSRILEPGDRVLDYDRAQGEDLYRLWDMVHTDKPLTKEALTEIEGLLDDDGVLVIQSGEEPSGLQDHFRKATRYQGMLLVQGPMNPEEARINTEKLRRDL